MFDREEVRCVLCSGIPSRLQRYYLALVRIALTEDLAEQPSERQIERVEPNRWP